MPKCLCDCVLVSIPKSGKDAFCSDNYCPIALASTLSKVLEHIILEKYSKFFVSNCLQFGFKRGSSTTTCTALVKSVVAKYIHSGSHVYGCFLDASKAFDMVQFDLLFRKLQSRGLPLPLLHFLSNWYLSQEMSVCWGPGRYKSFGVSNGVRQGGVLSPLLFNVYMDGLIEDLSESGVGCYWGHHFVGTFCYADDAVLLAPCASALRRMLDICSCYASSHGLVFNASKTQLVCFRSTKVFKYPPTITFETVILKFTDTLKYLGIILSFNLDDAPDIFRSVKDLNQKANGSLVHFTPPIVILIKMYCLALYECCIWSLDSPGFSVIEIAFNRILRKIWNLPSHSHTSTVHCVANIPTIRNIVHKRFFVFIRQCLSSASPLVSRIISDSCYYTYNSIGYNFLYGDSHVCSPYSEYTLIYSSRIQLIRKMFDTVSHFEDLIRLFSCS